MTPTPTQIAESQQKAEDYERTTDDDGRPLMYALVYSLPNTEVLIPVGTKLYAHSVPFTPIAADMVTDEMLAVYFDDDSMDWQNIPYPLVIAAKESCAGIINTFIKHRSKEMSIDSKIIAIQENKILELESQVEALRKDAEWKSIETAPKDVVLGFVPHQNENNGYVCPIIRTKENVWVNTSCPNFCEENPILWMPLPYPSDSAIKGEQAA